MKKRLFYKTLFVAVLFSANAIMAQDTDGDGIQDSVDVDDDNDGILDAVECGMVYSLENVGNSSFEEPSVSNGTWMLFHEDDVPGWKTTATDKKIELWRSGFLGTPAGHGNQLAELNANQTAALYQELSISGGSKIRWSVKHRGRRGTDVAQVKIGKDLASASIVETMSDGKTSWGTYTGVYNVPEGQDTTFFILEALSTSSGSKTIGNLIDDFSITIIEEPPCNTDSDGDGFVDELDIDSDNDGIPDNVEAQTTLGYSPPVGVVNTSGPYIGLWSNYGTGLTPVDTDSDGIPDYRDLNSDNDGYNDIEENGMANTSTAADVDDDGLINSFETNGVNDSTWDVNEDIENPADLSILPDSDSDLNTGGDLDYRDLFNINPPSSASVDFDGMDDFLSGNSILNGLGEVSIMAWIKIDKTSTGVPKATIMSEGLGCRLFVENGNQIVFGVNTSAGNSKNVNGGQINYDEWHHVAGIFSGNTGEQIIYIDGEQIKRDVSSPNIGARISTTNKWIGDFEVGRLSRSIPNRQYFKGQIDEIRVFNKALTESQVKAMVYQEINADSENIKGSVIPKNIVDVETGSTISSDNLIAYYPMTEISSNQILDYSKNNNKITMNNITTIQEQTAPMPYITDSNGAWESESTWLHGDVWDIEQLSENKDWCIVQISNNIETSSSHNTFGLIIDHGSTLTVKGSHLIKNSSYLKLNGVLDLMEDSQLLQTINSDLVTSADGKILRRQEGTSSLYRYNYWGSPVGAKGVTALSNNNAATNNTNNTAFTLDMIKDEIGINLSFTPSHHEVGKISSYWLYTYINGLSYWDWAVLDTNTPIESGVGYTQKGTGNAGLEQQYTFEGKPNNGTILINVTDKGGAGSVPSVSKTEYLFGNPYPSALDIHKFIDDNAGVIDGSLQLWQQWAGDSHQLRDYEGGYAQVNKLGSIRAYQFVGIEGQNSGSQDGTLTPSRYLPVGQGFITEIVADGNVEFNNSQRIFIKEGDADDTYNNGSSFFKNESTKKQNKNTSVNNNEANEFKKIRLELNSVSGPATRRELLLGFSETTTDGFDYGYEAECTDTNKNDFNLNFEGKNMNIQAYADITSDKVVSLNFKSSGSNTFEIKMTESEGIDASQEIYLRDNLTGEYFDLRDNTAYNFSSEQGKFNKRFEIVFQSEQKSLSIEEDKHDANFVYYQNNTNTLFAKKLSSPVSRLAVINMKGQIVMELTDVPQATLNKGLRLSNMSTGTYIVCMRTEDHQVITKKFIFN
ncbi:T9SS type A sorting domain-containing protein [Sabulilitoribacter arenilitoris]|uniref:T9SS type A sorting domain-containing protein n=1 Tax=Wocania arenilitoris TaxID=2044858 RepID=A0AAE3EMU2_9FLAO|nr:LamG-like jellyroll fold domain-containing protein [Wocania arenilitoris]MCF7566944.1 T9SS type A sorting domain-containing protein [Wocania arenilitoris]